ncbi:PREDICTED: uncharacterized protein LOC106125038 [Papilio xuthus]|uniref:Uncharacterized protein LOC106125038 n=1 Tax=Papilio xuthus TaxID=66420 RepID=A0AAJ6ZR86_PAPXU|nr:PREDICTED: uncharacterized protein LOC106125038 [Papilio xuthus]
MSTCVVEEGRDEGGGEIVVCEEELTVEVLPERPRRDVLVSARGRRACSEQGPHPSSHLYTQHGTSHLWGANSGRRGWSRKRTSAPQMGNTQGSMPRVALVLRSRRSWPVAPQSYRRWCVLISVKETASALDCSAVTAPKWSEAGSSVAACPGAGRARRRPSTTPTMP